MEFVSESLSTLDDGKDITSLPVSQEDVVIIENLRKDYLKSFTEGRNRSANNSLSPAFPITTSSLMETRSLLLIFYKT